MADSKHTPGPWTQYANGDQIYGADRFFITVVQSKNKLADARLIAAAPELLEALKNLAAAAAGGWPVSEELIAAGYAIAKAEGAQS
jgi:hypothetical protein